MPHIQPTPHQCVLKARRGEASYLEGWNLVGPGLRLRVSSSSARLSLFMSFRFRMCFGLNTVTLLLASPIRMALGIR